MKTVIIDDNVELAQKILVRLIDNDKTDNIFSEGEPRELAQKAADYYWKEVKGNVGDKKTILHIFINVEGKFGVNAKRHEQKGVEVLLWLRCKHQISNPVILYSFQTNQELLKKKPEHLIINSEGCYHLQLPSDFELIRNKQFTGVSDWNRLKKYLKPAFSIEEFRHREANWWGIIRLVDVHRALFPIELSFSDEKMKPVDYPPVVFDKINTIMNRMALFLYGQIEIDPVVKIIELANLKNQLKNTISEINHINKILTIHPNRKNPKEHELADFIEDRRKVIAENQYSKKWNVEIKPEIDNQIIETEQKIEVKKQELAYFNNREKAIETKLNLINNNIIEIKDEFIQRINKMRFNKTGGKKPKILYIDDKANEGWAPIFQLILYGQNRINNFRVVKIDSTINSSETIETKIDDIFTNIKALVSPTNINVFDPDVLLLDVRLIPDYDKEQNNNICEMSGPKLLKKIREEYPGIPVIITTASNKVWTYEELMRLGADAYWIKEGLDEQRTVEESVNNYISFLKIVHRASGREYNLLKLIAKKLHTFRTKNSFWWLNNITWPNGNSTKAISQDKVISLFSDTLNFWRIYLQQSVMGYGYKAAEIQSFWLRQIINQIAGIIEDIHFSGKPESNSNIIGGIWSNEKNGKWEWKKMNRKDWVGQLIMVTRNAASHQKLGSILYDFDILEIVLKVLMQYLDSENYIQFMEPEFINTHSNWFMIKKTWESFIEKNSETLKIGQT